MKYEDEIKMCEEGDIFYIVYKENIIQIKITKVEHCLIGDVINHYIYRDNLGNNYFNRNINKIIFKSKEDAEKSFEKKKLIIEKRNLLKKYEKELNDKLGLKDHIIF